MQGRGAVCLVSTYADNENATTNIGQGAEVFSQIVDVVELLLEVKVPSLACSLVDQPPDARQSVSVGGDAQPREKRIHGHQGIGAETGPDGTDSQADSVAKPVATGTSCRPVRADAGLAARSWIGAIGPDTRWCRDSSCVKYVRNPGPPAAFALVTALRGRVCKTVGSGEQESLSFVDEQDQRPSIDERGNQLGLEPVDQRGAQCGYQAVITANTRTSRVWRR